MKTHIAGSWQQWMRQALGNHFCVARHFFIESSQSAYGFFVVVVVLLLLFIQCALQTRLLPGYCKEFQVNGESTSIYCTILIIWNDVMCVRKQKEKYM